MSRLRDFINDNGKRRACIRGCGVCSLPTEERAILESERLGVDPASYIAIADWLAAPKETDANGKQIGGCGYPLGLFPAWKVMRHFTSGHAKRDEIARVHPSASRPKAVSHAAARSASRKRVRAA